MKLLGGRFKHENNEVLLSVVRNSVAELIAASHQRLII